MAIYRCHNGRAKHELHMDYNRMLGIDNFHHRRALWWQIGRAKSGFESFRKNICDSNSPPKPADEEEALDSSCGWARWRKGLERQLGKLKEQVGEDADDKESEEKNDRGRGRSRSKKKKRDRLQEPEWFGRGPKDRERSKSRKRWSRSGNKKAKAKEESRSRSRKRQKSRSKKASDGDGGPFGVGEKLNFGTAGRQTVSLSPTEEEEDSDKRNREDKFRWSRTGEFPRKPISNSTRFGMTLDGHAIRPSSWLVPLWVPYREVNLMAKQVPSNWPRTSWKFLWASPWHCWAFRESPNIRADIGLGRLPSRRHLRDRCS